MKIGFIGLGTMGAKMAANLQKAGYQLVVYDLRREAAATHLAAGAVWADTPRHVAEATDVVFTSLPGPVEVEQTALGEAGLLAGLRSGGAYFDLSTNSPEVVRRIHATFAAQGAHMMDAPVSGGPRGAATGKLAIWVGGEKAVFEQYKAVLDAIGDQARYVGEIGSATVAKLVHNCLGYTLNRALSEVFTMGSRRASIRSRCGKRCVRGRWGGCGRLMRSSINFSRVCMILQLSRYDWHTRM
jgi:3-hydroxyisobutyrate dehydrogenase